MPHLLVTNDFPPKVGGIQSYLWELWRRLPAGETTVLTTPYAGAEAFDAAQPFRIERTSERVLLPTRSLQRRIEALADDVGASVVVLDPVLPVGLLGPRLSLPYWVLVHGAELTIPGRLPPTQALVRRVLEGAAGVVKAGPYPGDEADRIVGRALPGVLAPPGVDADRFVPLSAEGRAKARAALGLPVEGRLVMSVSRLVPRKGMDVLVRAAALLGSARPDLTVGIAGAGRDRARLERLVADTGAPVRLLGRLADEDLPLAYGCGDVFAMLCHDRWLGLEQEGFGIVFLEAAAAGVPQIAGRSGGAGDAVEHGVTGFVVDRPRDPVEVADALGALLDDDERRARMGAAARARAVERFDLDEIAGSLASALSEPG